MKLLNISLMSSCNRRCFYCPVQKWFKPVDFRFPDTTGDGGWKINSLTNDALIKYLQRYIDPEEWIVELTGGEPGLYPEINTLPVKLTELGYRGVIKTNGTLPIPKTKNFPLVTAWHYGEECPTLYDWVLIIQNPKDKWKEKARHCRNNNIPCVTVGFDEWYLTKSNEDALHPANTVFTEMSCINSMGQLTDCTKSRYDERKNIFNMTPPPVKNLGGCPRCRQVRDVEALIKKGVVKCAGF